MPRASTTPPGPAAAALKRLREEARLPVRALAEQLGLGTKWSTYSSYENKYKKRELPVDLVQRLAPIFERAGISRSRVFSLAGIVMEEDTRTDESPISEAANTEETPGMATIEEMDVRGSAGGGSILEHDSAKKIYDWQVPREMLRTATYATPDRVKIITVVGDSMGDTFRPFERVMVDTSDTVPTPPGIFVVFDGLGVVVKRVEHVPHSDPPRVRISSDNPKYSPYERTVDEAYIQGRVLGRWQWV